MSNTLITKQSIKNSNYYNELGQLRTKSNNNEKGIP